VPLTSPDGQPTDDMPEVDNAGARRGYYYSEALRRHVSIPDNESEPPELDRAQVISFLRERLDYHENSRHCSCLRRIFEDLGGRP